MSTQGLPCAGLRSAGDPATSLLTPDFPTHYIYEWPLNSNMVTIIQCTSALLPVTTSYIFSKSPAAKIIVYHTLQARGRRLAHKYNTQQTPRRHLKIDSVKKGMLIRFKKTEGVFFLKLINVPGKKTKFITLFNHPKMVNLFQGKTRPLLH